MQGIAPQSQRASQSNELKFLPGFMALMLRDVADAFENHHGKVKVIMSVVDASPQHPVLDILKYKYYE